MDPGCADFLPGRLTATYGLEIESSLEDQLNKLGIGPDQITDVIFTHLHFDHGSGAFRRLPGRIVKRFPQASYHVLKEHFEYALEPDRKEADAFFTRFFRFIDPPLWLEDWKEEWLTFKVCYGHTHGMVVPMIHLNGRTTCYLSDLAPMAIFLKEDIFSGYDVDAETARREKQEFLTEIRTPRRFILFHDLLNKSVIYP
jgi:glyoxylase-like metal-dependent hydrolase (beta-lactamase superfamily II)